MAEEVNGVPRASSVVQRVYVVGSGPGENAGCFRVGEVPG